MHHPTLILASKSPRRRELLENMGIPFEVMEADIEETEDGLVINGSRDEESPMLSGGTAESFNDHRIAMSAAVAAGIATGDVTVMGTECTDKSFPGFWSMLENLKISE